MSSIKVLFRNYDNDMKLSMLTVLVTVMNFLCFPLECFLLNLEN